MLFVTFKDGRNVCCYTQWFVCSLEFGKPQDHNYEVVLNKKIKLSRYHDL